MKKSNRMTVYELFTSCVIYAAVWFWAVIFIAGVSYFTVVELSLPLTWWLGACFFVFGILAEATRSVLHGE